MLPGRRCREAPRFPAAKTFERKPRRMHVATAIEHYKTYKARPFKRDERDKVTILYGGLTWKHERIVQGVNLVVKRNQ